MTRRRASIRDLPAATWQPADYPGRTVARMLGRERSPELAVNACGYCGGSLAGMRRDALYCCDSHRVMASKLRRAA